MSTIERRVERLEQQIPDRQQAAEDEARQALLDSMTAEEAAIIYQHDCPCKYLTNASPEVDEELYQRTIARFGPRTPPRPLDPRWRHITPTMTAQEAAGCISRIREMECKIEVGPGGLSPDFNPDFIFVRYHHER